MASLDRKQILNFYTTEFYSLTIRYRQILQSSFPVETDYCRMGPKARQQFWPPFLLITFYKDCSKHRYSAPFAFLMLACFCQIHTACKLILPSEVTGRCTGSINCTILRVYCRSMNVVVELLEIYKTLGSCLGFPVALFSGLSNYNIKHLHDMCKCMFCIHRFQDKTGRTDEPAKWQ